MNQTSKENESDLPEFLMTGLVGYASHSDLVCTYTAEHCSY